MYFFEDFVREKAELTCYAQLTGFIRTGWQQQSLMFINEHRAYYVVTYCVHENLWLFKLIPDCSYKSIIKAKYTAYQTRI